MRIDPLGKKLALVIVDMQKKFVLTHEDMARQHDAPIARMNEIAAMFRGAGRPVIHVRFVGGGEHTRYKGPDADEFMEEMVIADSDIIVEKLHMNCFKESKLAEAVRAAGCDSVLLVGTVTQYCVISTYYGAFDHGLTPYISTDACISTKDEYNQAASVICKNLDADDVRRYLSGQPLEDCPPIVYHRGSMGDRIVEVDNLVVRFGDFTAVDGVSFHVERGEVFGFLGPNGAGKTTTIRTVTTIQRPTSGRILIDGYDTSSEFLEARKRIGIAQQHISLDNDLTIRQNLKHHAMLHKIPKDRIDRKIEESAALLELGDHMDKKVQELSGGWKRKSSIVASIIHDPTVLFLDEPTAGLDTRSRHMLWDLVRKLNRSGTTIFLTTHYIEEAESLCDRVAIIDSGRIIATGTVDELRDMIGRVAVEWEEGDSNETSYFGTREEARAFAETLGDRYYNIRRTSLEDVFLELTGKGGLQ
ncbi:MAG: isochorismatase family protein [Candidatus Methanomethylophilaceae archaeon]|nr:isochorismatase family protein [Candidatus Methanomethylophilaceae archaeon]